MKKRNIFLILVASVAALAFTNYSQIGDSTKSRHHLVDNKSISPNILTNKETATEPPPKEHDINISTEDFIKARKQARAMRAALKAKEMRAKSKYRSRAKSKTLTTTSSVPHWQSRGPKSFGRITAIVADPENPDKVYVGTPQGGVWKSTDGGAHYRPIFDHAGSLSIGALTLDPHDSDIIYVGTGECDHGYGNDTLGDGIWKSTDGGQIWEHLGLEEQHRIGSIVINPNNSMEIFAISYDSFQGGVFRSRDGGQTWKNISKMIKGLTRVRSMQMDPSNSSRLYASSWSYKSASIWKSEDSGDSWTKLTNGLPTNTSGVAFSLAPSISNRLYAAFPYSHHYDIYRSDDYGQTWEKIPALINGVAHQVGARYPNYCGKLIVSSHDKETFYILDMFLYKSIDGGDNFTQIKDAHLDHHTLWVSSNGETVYSGNDGGIYVSKDSGNTKTYTHQDLPIGQFYAIEVDPVNHNKILGGMQDNGSGYTTNGSDWYMLEGADGMTILVDNTNTSYTYCEIQHGGVSFFKNNHRIKHMHVPQGMWHTAMTFDAFNNKVVYYGSNYLYKTTRTGDRLSSLTKVSSKKFGMIVAIDVPISGYGRIIYVVDNLGIWVSKDRGITWTKATSGKKYMINHITVDPKNNAIVYVTRQVYNGESLYRIENYGQTWTNISGNLPHAGANDVLVDPDYSATLYIATDFGVYVSFDTGKTWEALGLDLPETRVKDLKLVKEGSEIILYAATYGRGFYSVRLTDAQRKRNGNGNTPTKPTAPINLIASHIQQTTATLAWLDKSDNETAFKVYRGSTLVKTLGANIKSLALTELTANTSYTYSVKAYNTAGESASTTTTFKTSPATPVSKSLIISPTTGTKVTPGSTITVTWKNHGASRKYFYAAARINGKLTTIKRDNTIQGTSTTVEMPLGFTYAHVYIFSYDADDKYLGASIVHLHP